MRGFCKKVGLIVSKVRQQEGILAWNSVSKVLGEIMGSLIKCVHIRDFVVMTVLYWRKSPKLEGDWSRDCFRSNIDL